jgi:phosphate transport system permease protein
MMVGAAVSSVCLTMLLFGRLTPLHGKMGFVLVAFALYLLVYGVLASLTERTPAVTDKLVTALFTAAALVAFFALASVIVYVFVSGAKALLHLNFFTQDMSSTSSLTPLTQGGVAHAIVGTLIMMTISLIITVPLGIGCAVYLNETRGKFANLVRTVVTAMTALPSILAGLFIFITWILVFHLPRSGLAASLAISIMMLPIIIRASDVVLRLVPGNLREASAALGAPQWRTVWHVVLPTARSGLTTAVILGVARGIGETAPVLLTAGAANAMNVNPASDPMISLPLAAFNFVKAPDGISHARGFAAAAVLMFLVLVLFTVARILGGRPAGRLSNRQVRKAAGQSLEDLARIEALSTRSHS